MAKHWTAGKVKTRLASTIGSRAAAALHRSFLLHLCQILEMVGDMREVVFSPDLQLQAARQALPDSWGLTGQGDGDLGQRMERWFRRRLDNQPHRIGLLIGADCPTLGPMEIERAAKRLAEDDVVFIPAIDGGYVLIGIRGPWREEFRCLFREIAWSTESVLAVSRDRARNAGLSVALMPAKEDIDTVGDLRRLRDQLGDRGGTIAGGDQLVEAIENVLSSPSPVAPQEHGDAS